MMNQDNYDEDHPLLRKDRLKALSNLSNRDAIEPFAMLYSIADRYGFDSIRSVLDEFLQISQSVGSEKSNQLIEFQKALNRLEEDQKPGTDELINILTKEQLQERKEKKSGGKGLLE